MSTTLILFIIVILFLLLLIIFAGSAPTQSRRTPPRAEQTVAPITQLCAEPEIEPRALPPPFAPAEPRALSEFFVPVPINKQNEQPFQFVQAKMNEPQTPPMDITSGHTIFNWDALCTLTGQSHRVCSCEECKQLRLAYGVS